MSKHWCNLHEELEYFLLSVTNLSMEGSGSTLSLTNNIKNSHALLQQQLLASGEVVNASKADATLFIVISYS